MPDEYPTFKDMKEREAILDQVPFRDVPKDELTVAILVGWAVNISSSLGISKQNFQDLVDGMSRDKLL